MFEPATTWPYLCTIVVALAASSYLLFKQSDRLSSYFAVWLMYTVASLGAAWFLKLEFFDLARLVSIGLFIGGVAMLMLCTFFSYRKFRALSSFFAIVGLSIALIGIDAFCIEPHALEVNTNKIFSNKLTKALKIAVISDFQTDRVSDYDRHAIATLMSQRPDMILWPGDYVQVNGKNDTNEREAQIKNVNALLKKYKVAAPMGVFAVRGNCEDDQWPRIFEGTGIKCFEKTGTAYSGDIAITGLGFHDSFASRMNVPHEDKFHIIFGHGPDFAISKPDGDLLVAGHTHGGQVQLPFIGAIFTACVLPRELAKGCCTKITKDSTLVVSRGVGMERQYAPRLRFMCKPEITIIEVIPERTVADTSNPPHPQLRADGT